MINKYENAIYQYSFWQSEIKRLRKAISAASLTELGFDSESGVSFGGERLCAAQEARLTIESYLPHSIPEEKTTCIERLWEENRLELNEDDDCEPQELCESCAKVQALVDERKNARKQFGIAKTRVSNLGLNIIRPTSNS